MSTGRDLWGDLSHCMPVTADSPRETAEKRLLLAQLMGAVLSHTTEYGPKLVKETHEDLWANWKPPPKKAK